MQLVAADYVISALRIARSAIRITADFRYPRYTCMYTLTHCTVADYFCQGMQLKNFGHFNRAPVCKIPVALQIFGTRIFSAFAE